MEGGERVEKQLEVGWLVDVARGLHLARIDELDENVCDSGMVSFCVLSNLSPIVVQLVNHLRGFLFTSKVQQRSARRRELVDIIGILLFLAGVLFLFFKLDDGVFSLFIQLYDFMSLGFVSPALIEEHLSEGIHHDVTNLHGLLHLNVLAIHSVVDHQHTCTLCGQ